MKTKKTLWEYLCLFSSVSSQAKLLGDENGWMTSAQVLRHVQETAGKLTALGIKTGDWVALRMDQSAQSLVILMALQAIGAVAPLTNAKVPIRKALADARFDRPLRYTLSSESGCWKLEKEGQLFTLEEAQAEPFVPSADPFAPAVVIFTSGSTGKSKGVILSQDNLICNLADIDIVGGYRKDDIALGALPMDHVFGLIMLYGAVVLQYALYLTSGGDLNTVLRTVQEQRITRMNGVPALYLNMAAQKDLYDLSSLRIGFIGGGPCTVEQFEKIEDELQMTLISGYGMSECMGISANDYRASRSARSGSVGPFYKVNDSRILDADGKECAAGQIGEVCTRGPQLMLGYCDDEQNRAAFDENGFFHTNDLGYLDEEGNLHLTGRKRDIIIRNGVNLSTRKIEEALLSIPGVEDAMVIGLPHDMQGEAPWALIKSSLPKSVILTKLLSILQKNELPENIYFAEEIPYNQNGKPNKIKGKELLEQWMKASF